MFKPGDQLIYVPKKGYEWVEKYIDSDLIQVVKEVVEEGDHIMLKLEDVRTHEAPVPAFCFDYECDSEDCWCGASPPSVEEFKKLHKEAKENGDPRSFEDFCADWL